MLQKNRRKKNIHSMIEENTKNYPSIHNHIVQEAYKKEIEQI
jgi:hypothetical protein